MPEKSTSVAAIESSAAKPSCDKAASCQGRCKKPCADKSAKLVSISKDEAGQPTQPLAPLRIKHIRPALVIGDEAELRSHTGGLTVAYRETFSGQYIELATAVCSRADVYNRRLGVKIATERFNAGARITLPTLGLRSDAAIERLLRDYFTAYISSDDLTD